MTGHALSSAALLLRECWDEFNLLGLALVLAGLVSFPLRRRFRAGRFGAFEPDPPVAPATTWTLALWAPIFWIASICVARKWPDLYMRAVVEDGWIENIQVAVLLLAMGLSLATARLCFRRAYRIWGIGYALFAVVLFWLAGEEISWGQRLFNLATPEWFQAHNVQHETNLHNLGDFDNELSNTTDIALQILILLTSAAWLFCARGVRRLHVPLWLPPPCTIPALGCLVTYGALLARYELAQLATPPAIEQLQESRELILYTAIATSVWFSLRHARTLRSPANPASLKKTPAIDQSLA